MIRPMNPFHVSSLLNFCDCKMNLLFRGKDVLDSTIINKASCKSTNGYSGRSSLDRETGSYAYLSPWRQIIASHLR